MGKQKWYGLMGCFYGKTKIVTMMKRGKGITMKTTEEVAIIDGEESPYVVG